MTKNEDLKAHDMPLEIYVDKDLDVYLDPTVYGEIDGTVFYKYTRANVTPTDTAMEDALVRLYMDKHEPQEHDARTADYHIVLAALQTRTPPVPVDTINIKREVMMGVREAMYGVLVYQRDWQAKCRENLASLDAVLSEGKP